MKNSFIWLSLFVLLLTNTFSSPTLVSAQDKTASGSSEIVIGKKARSDEVTAESAVHILENLERLAKDPQSSEQIKDKYDGVTNKTRGFIAQIISLKDDSFRVITPDNQEFFITPDKSTTIVKKGQITTGENYTLSDWFAIDDWLVLIGVQNNEVFQPRRILVSSESLAAPKSFVLRGTVKNSQKDKLDVAILGRTDSIITFKLDKDTNLVNQSNETITAKDLLVDTPVLLIGTEKDDKKTLQTLRLL